MENAEDWPFSTKLLLVGGRAYPNMLGRIIHLGTRSRKSLVGLRKPRFAGLHVVRWKQARASDRRPTRVLACLSPPYIVMNDPG